MKRKKDGWERERMGVLEGLGARNGVDRRSIEGVEEEGGRGWRCVGGWRDGDAHLDRKDLGLPWRSAGDLP